MIYKLDEDNKTVEYYYNNLNSSITKLRKSNLLKTNPVLYKEIQKFYNEIIEEWVEKYNLWNKDMDLKEEQELIDQILDLNNLIEKTLNK
jgi:hypothetical protein